MDCPANNESNSVEIMIQASRSIPVQRERVCAGNLKLETVFISIGQLEDAMHRKVHDARRAKVSKTRDLEACASEAQSALALLAAYKRTRRYPMAREIRKSADSFGDTRRSTIHKGD